MKPVNVRSQSGEAERRQDAAENPKETRESNQTLWLLAASPLVWAAHLLASYLTVAIWCAKVVHRDGSLGGARIAVAWYTVAALLGILLVGWIGLRRQSLGAATVPHDFDTPEDRHRFLGFATVLLSVLSAVATVFVALAAVFIESCH